MAKIEKVQIVEAIRSIIRESDGVIVANFRGLNVVSVNDFKKKIRSVGAESKVYKNTLIRLAFAEENKLGMESYLKDNTIMIYSQTDIVAALKVIVDFAKEKENLALKAAFISNSIFNKEQVIEISKLPGRKELLAQVVGGINSVLTGFVGTLNSVLTSFVGTVEAIEKKKSE